MLDRQKLEALLARRFSGSTSGQIAAAANAIMGLQDEWEEIPVDWEFIRRESETIELKLLRRRAM
jgi:hypothetical protein